MYIGSLNEVVYMPLPCLLYDYKCPEIALYYIPIPVQVVEGDNLVETSLKLLKTISGNHVASRETSWEVCIWRSVLLVGDL